MGYNEALIATANLHFCVFRTKLLFNYSHLLLQIDKFIISIVDTILV